MTDEPPAELTQEEALAELNRIQDLLVKDRHQALAALDALDKRIPESMNGLQAWTYAHLLRMRGELARSRGQNELAERLYNEALPLYRAVEDRGGEANTLRSLGDLAHSRGQNGEAERLYNEALPLYRAVEDRLGEANTLMSLGDLARSRGHNELAERLYN